ncbi:MAG: uroporphyrinogen-III synthase, partial [Chloroflexota bacterium]
DKVRQEGITAPAVIIVGEVVSLRDKLRWFDNQPLFGKRILVTRARRQASKLSRLLAERGAVPVELPAIDIQPLADYHELDKSISKLAYYQWIIFTSTNGVEAFWQRLTSFRMDSRSLSNLMVGAIGPATAQALEERGITADYIPRVYTGEGIIEGLKSQDISGKRILLPRADIADNELVGGLCNIGADVDEVAAYRTIVATEEIAKAKQMISSGGIDVITFTSSSTVTNLVAAFGGQKPAINNTVVACIGPKTKETAINAGLNVDILAVEQTIPGLVSAIENYFRKGA